MKKTKLFLEQYKNLSIQTKAVIWFVICSLLQKGISFITVPIFTRIMTSQQYGTYSLYLSWLQIMTIFTSLYLHCGVLDNAMSKFENDRDRYISSMQGLSFSIWSLFFIVFIFTKRFWTQIFGLPEKFILLMFLEMMISPALLFWMGRLRFEYSYRQVVFLLLSKSMVNPILGIFLVNMSNDKAWARVISIVIVEYLFSGVILIKQYRKGKSFFNKKYWGYGIKLALPMLPHYLSGMILNQGDRVMIAHMSGNDSVAYYSVAYSIGMLVQILTNAINSSMTPWFYKRFKTNETDEIKQRVNFLLIIVFGVALCLMLISPELIIIFGSSDYIQGQYVIPPVAASVFFIFLYGILSLPEFYFEKTSFLMIASIFAACFNMILNYFFIRKFGYISAGYTTLFCYVLYSIGHYIVSKKIIVRYLHKSTLYDIRIIFMLGILIIVCGIACNLLFPYKLVRYILLLVLMVLGVSNRNLILKNLSKV